MARPDCLSYQTYRAYFLRSLMLRLLWPLMLVSGLSACIGGIDYGKVEHRLYTQNNQCDAIPADYDPLAADQYFFVTSRLPDCQNAQSFTLTNFRGDALRYGRNQAAIVTADKKEKIPFAFAQTATWWRDLEAAAKASNGRVMVYVHGYNETFVSSTDDTVQMAALTEFQGPVVQYSWPSRGSIWRYPVDEANNEWDQTGYRRFLIALARQDWVTDIVLVSHSLGARLLVPGVEFVDAMLAPDQSRKISNIVLASPDIDRDTYVRHITADTAKASPYPPKRTITIYASLNDRALNASRQVHGYPRLGSPYCFDVFKAARLKADGDPERCYAFEDAASGDAVTNGINIIDTSAASNSNAGHSDYLHSAPVCADFKAVVQGVKQGSPERAATRLAYVFTLPGRDKNDQADKGDHSNPDNPYNICRNRP